LVREVYLEGNSTTSIDVSLCAGGSYGGVQIFNDTTLTTVLPTWTLSCDSTIIAQVDVTDLIQTSFEFNVCKGSFYNGIQLFNDTVIVDMVSLPLGCDSISTAILHVYPHVETLLFDTITQGGFVEVGGMIFSQAGLYEVPLQTWQGCDSIVVLDLTLLTGYEDQKANLLNIKAYPNPFNDQVWVDFELSEPSEVSLSLFDGMGRQVPILGYESRLDAGKQRIGLNGIVLTSGVYWLKINLGELSLTRRLVKIE
jgi:hypothetical protein